MLEGLDEGVEIGVVVGVIKFQVGDHTEMGLEFDERAIGFVGFGHQQPTFSMAGIAAKGGHDAADHGGGVPLGGGQQGGDQGAGGGLAVATSHGDRRLTADQRRQNVGSVHDRPAPLAGFQ